MPLPVAVRFVHQAEQKRSRAPPLSDLTRNCRLIATGSDADGLPRESILTPTRVLSWNSG
jgi:hypothetical protein